VSVERREDKSYEATNVQLFIDRNYKAVGETVPHHVVGSSDSDKDEQGQHSLGRIEGEKR